MPRVDNLIPIFFLSIFARILAFIRLAVFSSGVVMPCSPSASVNVHFACQFQLFLTSPFPLHCQILAFGCLTIRGHCPQNVGTGVWGRTELYVAAR